MTPIESFLELLLNPYLLLLLGIGYTWIIISKTKLHYKIWDRISLWKTINRLSESETKEWIEANNRWKETELKIGGKIRPRTKQIKSMLVNHAKQFEVSVMDK